MMNNSDWRIRTTHAYTEEKYLTFIADGLGSIIRINADHALTGAENHYNAAQYLMTMLGIQGVPVEHQRRGHYIYWLVPNTTYLSCYPGCTHDRNDTRHNINKLELNDE